MKAFLTKLRKQEITDTFGHDKGPPKGRANIRNRPEPTEATGGSTPGAKIILVCQTYSDSLISTLLEESLEPQSYQSWQHQRGVNDIP